MNLENWSHLEGHADIANLTGVDRFIFCGEIKSKEAFEFLVKNHDVKTFIDLKAPNEGAGSKRDAEWAHSLKTNYFNLPVSSLSEDINFNFHEKMRSILDASEGRVAIYCMSGNRVGFWFGRYLAQVIGHSKEKCLRYALKAGLAKEQSIELFKSL